MGISVSESEVAALRDGTFELRSLRCTLQRHGAAEPEPFRGPGFVRQLPDRSLAFTVFLPDLAAPVGHPEVVLGQVLPQSFYFRLTLIDWSGRLWTADSVLPEFQYFFSTGGAIATGRVGLFTLVASGLRNAPQSSLTLHIFTDLEITPTSQSSHLIEEGRHRTEKRERNMAVLDVPPLHIEITRWIGNARIVCTGTLALPQRVEDRVLEALQFVVAHRVMPAIAFSREGNSEQVRVYSSGLAAKMTPAKPPVPSNWTTSPELVWRLFSAYFTHLLTGVAGETHPLSSAWDGILRAEAATVDTAALKLCTAVETLARLVPGGEPAAPGLPESSLDEWIGRIEGFLEQEQCEPSLRKRFAGLLAQARFSRTKDRLYVLAKAQVISEELIAPWNRVRHPAAHGAIVPASDREQLLYDCDAILTLLHQLTFAIIGYRGHYAFYAVRGYPAALYPIGTSSPGRPDEAEADA